LLELVLVLVLGLGWGWGWGLASLPLLSPFAVRRSPFAAR
jgi:hypothetical protein